MLGSKGQLGKEFVRFFRANGANVVARDINRIDIADADALRKLVRSAKPNFIVNCAAYNQVEQAEINTVAARQANAIGPMNVATISAEFGAAAVHFSTDYVFSGKFFYEPYTEEDSPQPINMYGKTKLEGEKLFLKNAENGLLFRVSWLYGKGEQNFIYKLRQWAKGKSALSVSNDETSVPTSTKFVVENVAAALQSGLSGLYHLVPSGFASRFELALEVREIFGFETDILPVSMDKFPSVAKRPKFSAMSAAKFFKAIGKENPHWRAVLRDYFAK